MLIDYLTLSISPFLCSKEVCMALESKQDTVLCVSPDGEVIWSRPAHNIMRSDTHQITFRLVETLDIMGSPAHFMGEGHDNVFGSLDIRECFYTMVSFVSDHIGYKLPDDPELWKVRRVDITGNYFLGSLTNVKQALSDLRESEGGRYQIKTAAETVYWSQGSRLRSGKAYAKGPHMKKMDKKHELGLTQKQLDMLQGLLRLELQLGSQFWRRKLEQDQHWYNFTSKYWKSIFEDYFMPLIGHVEVSKMSDIPERLNKVAPTARRAQAALNTWLQIKEFGLEGARARMSRSKWYQDKKLLNQAGLGWSDFQQRKIVSFRRKTIVMGNPVTSWDDLERRYDKCCA